MPSPNLQYDSNHNVVQNPPDLRTYRAAYDVSNNKIYEGWALPGLAEGTRGWSIRKLTYTSTYLTDIKYPQLNSVASNSYSFSWTDRASYTYS